MDLLITHNDFVGEYNLSINELNQGDFNSFVSVRQVEFLRKIFGVTMYNEYKTGMETLPIESKWTDLNDGCDFTYSDYAYHFDGVKEALKAYVYSQWLQSRYVFNVSSGNVILKNENAENTDPAFLVQKANNKCIEICDQLRCFVYANTATYPNFLFSEPFGQRYFNTLGI
jgi:hypothetical protein